MKKAPTAEVKKSPLWERIVSSTTALGIISLVGYLVVRNEPFKDPNLVVLIRTVLSLGAGLIGALIPGFLDIQWNRKGFSIRAIGAIGLVLLTFFGTPSVLPNLDVELTRLSSQMEKFDADFSQIDSVLQKKELPNSDRQEISLIYEKRKVLKEAWNSLYQELAIKRRSSMGSSVTSPIEKNMKQMEEEIAALQHRLENFRDSPPAPARPQPPTGLRVVR